MPGCIFRQKTWRIFFSLSFANKPSFSREPSETRFAPHPAPARRGAVRDGGFCCICGAVADSSRPAEPRETIHTDKWKTICARDSNHYHLG